MSQFQYLETLIAPLVRPTSVSALRTISRHLARRTLCRSCLVSLSRGGRHMREATCGRPQRRSRVLILSDDPVQRDALSGALAVRCPEVQVKGCRSASQALQDVNSGLFNVLLTTSSVRGLDTPTLIQRLAACRFPVSTILVAGPMDDGLVQRAQAAHPILVLREPLDRHKLAAAIRLALEINRGRRAEIASRFRRNRRAARLNALQEIIANAEWRPTAITDPRLCFRILRSLGLYGARLRDLKQCLVSIAAAEGHWKTASVAEAGTNDRIAWAPWMVSPEHTPRTNAAAAPGG